MGNSSATWYWSLVKYGRFFSQWRISSQIIVKLCRHYISVCSGNISMQTSQLLSAFLCKVLQDLIFWSNVCIAVRARIQATYVRGCSIFTRYDKEGISQKWLKWWLRKHSNMSQYMSVQRFTSWVPRSRSIHVSQIVIPLLICFLLTHQAFVQYY